jgi:hypothetical protein
MTELLIGILMMLMGQADLDRRGALAMGFDQQKTTHAFVSTASGGSIEVRANEADDAESTRQIRTHLAEIAKAFAAGDFTTPFQTHGEVPPGVPGMRRLKGVISYEYAEAPRGAIVRIATKDPVALAAVHEFLAYQRREHSTPTNRAPD